MTDKPMIQLFTGNANPGLARRISEYVGHPLGDAEVSRYPDGETSVKINEDVRGVDVFAIQSTEPPVNENLMELLIMIDSLVRASAERITAVIPYFGYARQDRKAEGRTPISAKLVANLLTTAGADRILTVDLHSGQIQGFFDIPLDHLYAAPVMSEYLKEKDIEDPCIVSPDVGTVKLCRGYAKRLDGDLAIVDKRRIGPDNTEAVHLIGEVEGKSCIVLDDMISTGGSMRQAVKIIRDHGAKNVSLAATHGIFCRDAAEKMASTDVSECIVTDTVTPADDYPDVIRVLSTAELLGEAIIRIHEDRSVSALFV